jgi:glycosyltransferase involved in cell wall biosynthesis
MKIAVTGTRGFPRVQGGVENHCEKLYTHLADRGCDITVFTRKPYVDPVIKTYKGVSLVSIDCTKNKFLEAVAHTFKGVLKARSFAPDVLHIHAIGPSLFTPLARILGMRVIVTNHGPDYEREKWPLPVKIFLKFCERMGMTFANEVIAIAENIAVDIRRKFRRDAFVLPNGVDIPKPADTYKALEKFGLASNKYILAVGRFVPEKGFHDLIETFNVLKTEDDAAGIKEWKLVIAGGADHEDKYSHGLKMKAGKNSDIILTGFLTGQPLHELYSHAGLFVLPSYHEGLPIVLIEAMSYGLSCIASDIPANKNIELHEGRFFKAGNVDLLAAKIKEFISKPWKDKDRKKQISLIADKYNWEKIADETLKVYRQIIS